MENYHCHKDFSNTSTPDCAESIENYANRIKEFNTKCLYSGEHGSQGNQFLVYTVAEKMKLKYRHSVEAYWVKDRLKVEHESYIDSKGKEKTREIRDKANCHMIIVAKNKTGREDINYILSRANEDGYYYKPRVDFDLLFSIPKNNVIVTSACIAGWKYEDAEDIWMKIHEYFGDNFFLEVQNNNTDKQKKVNKNILCMARENNIQIICGLDSHYITDENSVKRDQILKYKNISYPEEFGWYMDYPDTKTVIKRFQEQGILSDDEIIRAIMNTNIFVNECEDIILDRSFKIPTLHKEKTYKQKCKIYHDLLNKGYAREVVKSKEKANGIVYEANQVTESGVVDYFLTTKGIIDDAIKNEDGILTTTSRGSAASFTTNKLLGLTTVDRFTAEIPIYPERFLTKERVLAGQMPDIDNNIPEQEPFIRSSKKLLSEHGCYPLMAIEKLKDKNAWQLYASVNNVSPTDANMISKYIDEYDKKMKHATDEEKEVITVDDYIPLEYQELFHQSNDYRGITINLKVHTCGYMLLNWDIRREIGLISAVSETTEKRTLCACIEGKYLDDFGYVKEDFLIVDSVGLTNEFFNYIGMKVPTFDELKEMVRGDKLTWDIYERGITCCINQCESPDTTNKGRRYKPKTIAELAAFIAGIRPGFASLINKFINREEYSTGEPKIDELLKDTFCYMIYQESIMKVLSFLGLKMDETYGVIKSISKKKYKDHPEQLRELKDRLRAGWIEEIGNDNNFENVWKIIEDSAFYAFNSPHAYSMAGDSLYQAWGKAHYTSEFYECAINHYQRKNNKDKINSLVREAIKFFDYKLGDYEFGADNRKVTINKKDKIIYPNLSSIKGFGEGVSDILYDIGLKNKGGFITVLEDILSSSINKTVIDKLIKIGYFNKFGCENTLLETVKYFDLLYSAKTISKIKATYNNIPIYLLQKYGHETEKQFNKIDSFGLFNEMLSNIKDIQLPLRTKIYNQLDILGIISEVDPTVDKRIYYVSEVEVKKSIVNIKLYEIYTGKIREAKMWTNTYTKHIFSKNDILYVISLEKKNKKEPTGEINPTTNKKVYRDVPNKYEFWLQRYAIKADIPSGGEEDI